MDVGDHVIETTWPGGVHKTAKAVFYKRYRVTQHVDIDVPNELAAHAFLMAQVGKRYDWAAIVGFVVRRQIQNPRRWFCSELVEATLAAGGKARFREKLSRVTPHHVWMIKP